MRKNIVAGNWKMNTTPEEGLELALSLIEQYKNENVQLIIAPPYTHLWEISKVLEGTDIYLSSQNIAKEDMGAYTGEIAAEMLKNIGVQYTIIGHSERRAYYNESHKTLTQKINKALATKLNPIFCVGEKLEDRENNKHFDIIKKQLEESLFHLSSEEIKNVIIAYEPVWAIGTGKTASSGQAQEIHAYIRQLLAEKYNVEIAENISILYGGSCKPSNAKELFQQKDIDGGLIGGAALKSEDFLAIADSF
jgi:triosephosphate isomerase